MAARLNDGIGFDRHLGFDVRRTGIDDRHPAAEQVVDLAPTRDRVGVRQLESIVHAEDFLFVLGQCRLNRQSLCPRNVDKIWQVVLAFGAQRKVFEVRPQPGSEQEHGPAPDLVDGALFGRRVHLLDHAIHASTGQTNHPTVAMRIPHARVQQRDRRLRRDVRRNKTLQRFGPNQRLVAVMHEEAPSARRRRVLPYSASTAS